MDKEKVKAELNKKYTGQPISPSSIIDIIVDAIELSKAVEYQGMIENKPLLIEREIEVMNISNSQYPYISVEDDND